MDDYEVTPDEFRLVESPYVDPTIEERQAFVTDIVERPAFRAAVEHSVRHSISKTMPHIEVTSVPEPDWGFALLCASSMTDIHGDERAQQSILRVAQGCLASDRASVLEREAARTLLRRVGNLEAIRLAERRNHLSVEPSGVQIPLGQEWETASTQAGFQIAMTGEERLDANPFQKKFWDAASAASWVSVSAPTSAGKSFILRKWITQNLESGSSSRAVYLTPTRALVEEASREFLNDSPTEVPVITMPWDERALRGKREIYVLTQERLHLLQHFNPNFVIDLLVVDESQKIGEEARGILMSNVIDEASERNRQLRVVFASPMSSNPEALLLDAPEGRSISSLVDGTCTVNQNLLYVDQMKGTSKGFRVQVATDGYLRDVGSLTLEDRPTNMTMRMAMIVLALGEASNSNLIYANGPGSAQTMAIRIAEYRDAKLLNDSTSAALAEAVEYIGAAIHPKFSLCSTLPKGVAFHYGPIPLHVKEILESLFKEGYVKYLVCTSTLLEGVNLPCTNIFVRAPKKGKLPLDPADFWNLAGRAGRWGREYNGNIVCIDAAQWPDLPLVKARQTITRAVDLNEAKVASLEEFARRTVREVSHSGDEAAEALLGLLSSRAVRDRQIASITGMNSAPDLAARADAAVRESLESVELPDDLLALHASISPNRIQSLVNFFRSVDADEFALPSPESHGAKESYAEALRVISEHLGGPFGNSARRLSLARLITRWMRGHAMRRIIDDRHAYYSSVGQADWKKIIDAVMEDVEKICRYEAPKYLACYSDALSFAAGRTVGFENAKTVTMMLELGVPRTTDMSLIALGLSRATTIAVGELQKRDNFSPSEALDWLKSVDWEQMQIQGFAVREVQRLLAALPTGK